MVGRRPPGPEVVRALRLFGFEAEAIFPMTSGYAGVEWRAVVPERMLLVRRHDATRPDHAIAWEHEFRAYMAEKGWPTCSPLRTRDGRDVVGIEGERYSLYPFSPGRAVPRRGPGGAAVLGRVLARFHRDARLFPRADQPEGLGRAWELDALVQPTGLGGLSELLVAVGRESPTTTEGFRRQRFRLVRDLARHRYADLPSGVVLLEFHRESVPFEAGQPATFLRLELAHWDALVFDIAATLIHEAWNPARAGSFDLSAAFAFLEGYDAFRPLEPEEWQALPVFVRAVVLWNAVRALSRWWCDGDARALTSAKRALERQLPAIEAHALQLVELAAVASRRRG